MKSLLDLAADLVSTTNKVIENEGELTAVLEQELDEINTQLSTKADHYAYRIDKLEKAVEFWEEREKKAYQAKKTLKDHVKNMKERIKFVMKELDKNEIVGEETIWKLRNTSVPKLILDQESLPQDWKTRVEEWVSDNKRIKEALQNGEKIEGAILEYGSTLTTAINTEHKKIGG